MAIRNVHKEEAIIFKLPVEAIAEDRGLSYCETPQLVVASLDDAAYYKNDRTALAYKFDAMTIELEDSSGNAYPAPGVEVTFPYQSDAIGFVIDWRQVAESGALVQGCWRVKVNWEIEGVTGWFYYGAYELKEYSPFNVRGTVRLFVVLNDLVRKQGINYKDSGFAGTVRFKGFFGDMQPNYDTENIVYTDRTREKVRNEALRTYELRSNYLLHCMTRLIDEEHLLAANQIYISDHNASNHVQNYYDFPVILSEDESPKFDYTGTVYAKVTALFNDKVQVHESKYDGNIKGSSNVILSLPTVVSSSTPCEDANVTVNGVTFGSVASGGTLDVPVKGTDGDAVGSLVSGEWIVGNSEVNINSTVIADVPTTDALAILVELDGTPAGSWNAGTQTWEVASIPPTPRSTATLMKTGQTVSYRTGDDGDLEAGRSTSFLVLDSAPLHDNGSATLNTTTNRFTDILGGQTFATAIVLDWSTWNGSTLLAYSKNYIGSNVNWNTAIDNALTTSLGTFTTGWRLVNRREMENITYEDAPSNRTLNFAPFSNTFDTNYWTSTTCKYDTSRAWILGSNSTGWYYGLPKSSGACSYYVCRTMTLSTSNVLS